MEDKKYSVSERCTCKKRINSFCDVCLRHIGIEPEELNRPGEIVLLVDDVEEYLHWRKVNPHIKGGENYLKRLKESLAGVLKKWAKLERGEG